MKLFDFMIARGCDVELRPLTAPTVSFGSLVEVFETVQRQEHEVSAQIDALYELAFREKAFAATVELQWFLTEQVEEEQSAREILSKIRHGAGRPCISSRSRSRPGLARTRVGHSSSVHAARRILRAGRLSPSCALRDDVAASHCQRIDFDLRHIPSTASRSRAVVIAYEGSASDSTPDAGAAVASTGAGSGAPKRTATRRRRHGRSSLPIDRPIARPQGIDAVDRHRHDGRREVVRQDRRALLERLHGAVDRAFALGKQHEHLAVPQAEAAGLHRRHEARVRIDRDDAREPRQTGVNGVSKYSLAPTKNSCRNTWKGSAPATRNESR